MIPEFLPVLSAGAHSDPRDGACVMEYVSLLAGEPFRDTPACTHPVLACAAQVVNDRLPDAERHRLVPLIGRLFGTAPTGSDLDRQVLSVTLLAYVDELRERARKPVRDALASLSEQDPS